MVFLLGSAGDPGVELPRALLQIVVLDAPLLDVYHFHAPISSRALLSAGSILHFSSFKAASMTASLPSLLAPDDEDDEEEEDCEGGGAGIASMLSMSSLICCSCTPSAMMAASLLLTSPRNVSLMIYRVFSSTDLFDALSASERAPNVILV